MNNKKLKELYNKRTLIESQIYKIIKNCKHKIVKREITKDCGSAVCSECGEDFGWWCPESPDHTCYYYTEVIQGQFIIRMADGSSYPYKKDNHDRQYETEDCCLFCGHPNERK